MSDNELEYGVTSFVFSVVALAAAWYAWKFAKLAWNSSDLRAAWAASALYLILIAGLASWGAYVFAVTSTHDEESFNR